MQMYRVAEKMDYLTFQLSLWKFALNNASNASSTQTNMNTDKTCVFKYSAVINILCDLIADVLRVSDGAHLEW